MTVWVVRQGCKGGTYLWGWGGREYDYGISSGRPPPTPEWGEQGGATRYKDRVQAVRDARKSGGRIVKLKPRGSVVAQRIAYVDDLERYGILSESEANGLRVKARAS